MVSSRTRAHLIARWGLAAGLILLLAPALAEDRQSIGTSDLPIDLDLGIRLDLPPGDSRRTDTEADLHSTELRIIAVQLVEILSRTGRWRSVSIVPDDFHPLHVQLTVKLIASDSNMLAIAIDVIDASGRRWFDRKYREVADPCAYDSSARDPFHFLYSRIARDLTTVRGGLSAAAARRLDAIARLRFAAELAPAAFGSHLAIDSRGRTGLKRLPAARDALLERIDRIRQRHLMTVDVITELYLQFLEKVREPYDFYRGASYEVHRELDKLRWVANLRQIEYGVPMELYPSIHGPCSKLGPGPLIPKPLFPSDLFGELDSLSEQFTVEAESARREVDSTMLRLRTSLESRYAAWRALVRRIAASETGTMDFINPRAGDRHRKGEGDISGRPSS